MKRVIIISSGLALLAGAFYLVHSDTDEARYASTESTVAEIKSHEQEPNSYIALLESTVKNIDSISSSADIDGSEIQHLGEYIDPAQETFHSTSAVMHLGEYVDPDVVETQSRFSQPVLIGEAIENVDDYIELSRTDSPVSLGEYISDPEAWIAQERARTIKPRNIGEPLDPIVD